MHFTQQPSMVTSRRDAGEDGSVVVAELHGFITTAMLVAQFDDWDESFGASMPEALIVDLRGVSAYASGTAQTAQRWLDQATHRGVRRIALIASSSVLRTIVQLIAVETAVELRCFDGEAAARRWLVRPLPA